MIALPLKRIHREYGLPVDWHGVANLLTDAPGDRLAVGPYRTAAGRANNSTQRLRRRYPQIQFRTRHDKQGGYWIIASCQAS